jgi:CNT family concentrative nucleoside transporter
MGVPKPDLLTVAGLLGTKLVQNEFVAFLNLSQLQPTMTARGYNIAVYALCGFGNLGSLGIQIGVLSALGPARKSTIVKCSVSALACGFLATCQTAGIAGQLL